MQISDILSLSQKAIRSNRLRSNLTVAIIAIGITALIGIITIIEVLKGTIYSNFTSMGSNTFSISENSFVSKSKSGGRRRRMNQNEEQNRIKLNEVDQFKKLYQFPSTVSLSVMATNTATVKRGKKKSNPNIIVMGTDENYLSVSGTALESGRNFTASDIGGTENTCILGNAIALKFFESEQDAADGLIYIGDARYRVLGVMESKGASFINRTDNMVLISLNNARQRFNVSQRSYVISVSIPDIKYMNLATDEAEGTMRTARRLGARDANNFSINKNDEIANSLIGNLQYVTLSASVIGLITLLGAAIGLMNIMLVSVAERTREIGLSKAIGANSFTIRLQFLSESVIISLKGGLIGIIIGILIGNILTIFFKTAFVIPWLWIGIGFSICIIVGLMAGIYPAMKASRLNPIEALRHE
ncbi:MAG: ABC transporter permease [Chitinophagaceae bacterium]|nr:ABC transporter permease [Chitinophagaceae bacterium]